MRVALVYDRVNKWGGAERVLLALHKIFPEASLYTSVYNPRVAPWASIFPKVYTSFLQKWPHARDRHEHYPYLMPLAFESFSFDSYDLVISVTSEAAKGIITKPTTRHICYCLTPTRYLWSGYEDYFKSPVLRLMSRPAVDYLREWDKVAAQRPDTMVAISNEVRGRIKKYYGRESRIIFPAVGVRTRRQNLGKGEYYLVVSRLVSYKRVDLAVAAFNRLGCPLIIVGTGQESERLKVKGKSNIKFVGYIGEAELANYYAHCRALIMPQEEDFGLVALEAQSLGKPVIAYKKGGVLDTVIEGKTGIFFKEQTAESLVGAVKRFEKMELTSNIIVRHVEKFSFARFKKEILGLL